MITDSYSKMMSDVSMRSMLKNSDYGEELGMLIRERRRQEAAGDREKELSMYRSGSAPPTVEGALNAVGGLFDAAALSGLQKSGGKGFASDEEFRADSSYVNYYYSNANLNPRLPPPLQSKEDWRFTQRLHGGGIGEWSRNGEDAGNGNRSLFSVQPGYGGKEDSGVENKGATEEWVGDGLIGLPGPGLGRQKSIAEIIQDDISQHPSYPVSRNAFDAGVELSGAHFALLEGISASQSIGAPASHSYASALGGSLSRSTTPDPQLLARAPSPRNLPVGGGRASSLNNRNINGPNPYNGASSGLTEPAELVAGFSGLNISTNGVVNEENHSLSQIQHEVDGRCNLFNLQDDQNHVQQHAYHNNSESRHLHLHSAPQAVKGIYPDMGKGGVIGMDLKNSSSTTLNGGRNSPSHYQNMHSSIPNYGLNGYTANPVSPPMMGQLGSGNLPPLFEWEMNGLDSRAHAGGLSSGTNLMAAASELQNLSKMGNQVPLMETQYLQYLRSQEYAAAHLAALNDPTLDREGMGNSYMDLLGLQKAYLGQLLSPQKSQYGVPYLGDSGSLSHGYYGNPALTLGMSYPGGLFGSGSPTRNGGQNMRFASGMRNPAGGVMGAWHSEVGGSLDRSFTSSLLDEFKTNKTKCFELSEIAGHVAEFSTDQYGSRFIQQKLESASLEEKNMVFTEIMHRALSLMTDVFGNYVIQKFFEHGSASQIRELADQLTGHVLTLSLQMYGCRVIQKAIEVVELDQQTKMVTELDGHIMRCVRDQNGNHVIQKCIECIPEDAIQFIVSTFYDHVVTLSTHPYGCRVIQRVLEHCHDPKTQSTMMDAIMQSVGMLAQDQYGNYVVQHVLEHGKPEERSTIIKKLAALIVPMSQQKFASNVVEKCLCFGTQTERQILVTEMLGTTDENEPLQAMMKDQYANYVVQKVLETCDEQQLELILNRIKVHLNALKKYTYGKHIVARVEKLVAAGERRISIQTAAPHAYPRPAA